MKEWDNDEQRRYYLKCKAEYLKRKAKIMAQRKQYYAERKDEYERKARNRKGEKWDAYSEEVG